MIWGLMMDSVKAIAKSKTILSCLLTAHEYDNINIDILMETGLSKQWFKLDIHQQIFDVINICYKAKKAFNDITIVEYLQKANIQNCESIIIDIMLEKQIPQSIAIEYILSLKNDYQESMIIDLASQAKKMIDDGSSNPELVIQMIQNSINNFDFLENKGYTKSLTKVREKRKKKKKLTRLKTEIPFIDTVLTDKHGNVGIRNEGLFFISGLKQSGKTFILMRIIENLSKHYPVMFGSMEFGEDLYDETVEEMQEDGFFNGNTDNIHVFDSIYDVDGIIAEIRYQHKLNGIKLVALDSMLRMTNNDPLLKTDERRISDMFSKLGKLSKELGIPIIIIVQSSKEDLKSSIVSVKGSMNADHEAYVWFHIFKTDTKNPENEQRTVIWVKNKDTRKHPKQHLMFVPQTSDFYRVELDKNGHPFRAIDNYRKPKYIPPTPQISVYEAAGVSGGGVNQSKVVNPDKETQPLEVDESVFNF